MVSVWNAQNGVITSHSSARIFPCSSNVTVCVSNAYRNKENTSASRRLIVSCMDIVQPLYIVFSLEIAVIDYVVFTRISGLDNWSSWLPRGIWTDPMAQIYIQIVNKFYTDHNPSTKDILVKFIFLNSCDFFNCSLKHKNINSNLKHKK